MSVNPAIIFAGRFQPPHIGHFSVVEYICENHDKPVIIGIVNPDPWETWSGDGDNFDKFARELNPLNYWERYHLFKTGLQSSLITADVDAIVPLPRPSVNQKKAERFLPDGPKIFAISKPSDSDFESWKERKYQEHGYEILNVNRDEFSGIVQLASGTLIRNLAAIENSTWQAFVPDNTIPYLRDINFEARVSEFVTEEQALDKVKSFTNEHPKQETAAELLSKDIIFS